MQTSKASRGAKAIKHPGIVTLQPDLNAWNIDKKCRWERDAEIN